MFNRSIPSAHCFLGQMSCEPTRRCVGCTHMHDSRASKNSWNSREDRKSPVTRLGQPPLVLIFFLGQMSCNSTRRCVGCPCMLPEPQKIPGIYGRIGMELVTRFGQPPGIVGPLYGLLYSEFLI